LTAVGTASSSEPAGTKIMVAVIAAKAARYSALVRKAFIGNPPLDRDCSIIPAKILAYQFREIEAEITRRAAP